MAGDQMLPIHVPGSQTRFEVPARLKAAPKAIQAITPQTQRRRAQDAWKAACQFQALITLWDRFLWFGMLRLRLEEPTESEIIRQFPELQDIGGVLNMLAEQVPCRADFAEELRRADKVFGIRRGPTERHQNDQAGDFGGRTVQRLVETFRRLMRIEAEGLRLLEVRKEAFQQPREALRSDVIKLTCIDMHLTLDGPLLNFTKTLKSADYQETRHRLARELRELLEQLGTYPDAVLQRPEHDTAEKTHSSRSRSSLTREEANIKVRE